MRFEGPGIAFGDIVLVPFPFTDQSRSKQRPAVVVSNSAYNASKPDVVVMAITSQFRPSATLGEVWLSDWQTAGLLKPSVVKPVFATSEQSLLIRRIGGFSVADQIALLAAMTETLGEPLDHR